MEIGDYRCLTGKLLGYSCGPLLINVSTPQTACREADRLSRKLNKSTSTERKDILSSFITSIELHPAKIIIDIDGSRLRTKLTNDATSDVDAAGKEHIHRIEIGHTIKRRGVEAKIVLASSAQDEPTPDHGLIMTVAKAHYWFAELTYGTARSIDELAELQNEDRNEISRFLPLAHLAPDIVEKILEGRQPVDLTLERIRRLLPLPLSWKVQRELLGFAG